MPHVEAATWNEALYAWGYMHAVDRPTQVYFARAIASGQATERIANKPELLEMDILLRRAGLYRDLEREFRSLPDATREQLDWYCQGVNDGLVDAGRTLPMWVTGFRPRPWEPESVLLIGKLLSFAGLTIGEQENERLLLELIQLGVDDERLRELFTPYLDGIDFEPLREIRIAKRMSDETLELLADLPRLAGSNAWAVSPARSATGHAMLASDPHLEVNRLPSIWYEIAHPLGRWRIRDGRDAARLPDHGGWPHAPALVGRHVHARRHERFFHRRLPARRLDRLAISPGRALVRFSATRGSHPPQGRRADRHARVRKRAGHPQSHAGCGRGARQVSVGVVDRRTGRRRPCDQHLARRDRRAERGRRHGSGARRAASVARVAVCR